MLFVKISLTRKFIPWYANLKEKKKGFEGKAGNDLESEPAGFPGTFWRFRNRNVTPITKEGGIRIGLVFLHLKSIPLFSCRFINVILEADVSYKTTQGFLLYSSNNDTEFK